MCILQRRLSMSMHYRSPPILVPVRAAFPGDVPLVRGNFFLSKKSFWRQLRNGKIEQEKCPSREHLPGCIRHRRFIDNGHYLSICKTKLTDERWPLLSILINKIQMETAECLYWCLDCGIRFNIHTRYSEYCRATASFNKPQ